MTSSSFSLLKYLDSDSKMTLTQVTKIADSGVTKSVTHLQLWIGPDSSNYPSQRAYTPFPYLLAVT